MATSSVSSTASSSATPLTTAQIAAAKKASSQALLTSLGAGSGVDVVALAQNLVDADKIPQQNIINTKISTNDKKVSGYAAISYMLGNLNTAIADLKDTTDYNSMIVSGASSAYAVTPSDKAQEGQSAIQVLSIYKPQKSLSTVAYSSATDEVLSGDFAINGTSISVSTKSPKGLVEAINLTQGLGVTAKLVDTGAGFKISLTGTSGESNQFSFTNTGMDAPSDQVNLTNLQNATDARIKVDGVEFKRSTNNISDVITGVTLNLRGTTMATDGVTANTDFVSLSRDTASLKTKFDTFVTAYNDVQSLLKEVSNPKSTLEDYGATLVGDSTVRMVKSELRNIFSKISSTPGTSMKFVWQIGMGFDATGVMSLDATKFNSALAANYDDVVKMLTGNQKDLSKFSPAPAGYMGDATYKIYKLISPIGPIATQSLGATKQTSQYKEQLTALDSRMQMLLDRYTKQFSAMQSIVGNANSQKTSLKSTFDGMMASYTNK